MKIMWLYLVQLGLEELTEDGLLALREWRMKVTHAHFKKAKEKVMFKKKEGVPEGLYMWRYPYSLPCIYWTIYIYIYILWILMFWPMKFHENGTASDDAPCIFTKQIRTSNTTFSHLILFCLSQVLWNMCIGCPLSLKHYYQVVIFFSYERISMIYWYNFIGLT